MRNHTYPKLGLALFFTMVLGVILTGAAGAETTGITEDGFAYSIQGDKATITQYTGNETTIAVPAQVEGIPVIAIGEYALGGSAVISVTIPNSITDIGELAFAGCSGLTSITIPESVTNIGSGAFSFCSSLTSITIPESITKIAEQVFEMCSGLTSITIPDSVISIGANAFIGCSNITSVTIPPSVTNIETLAFRECSSLTSVTIPEGVISIGDNAFGHCSSLTSVTIPHSVTSMADRAFSNCSSLVSVTIGEGVTSIGDNTFSYCTSLTSVTIPDSVTYINYYAFYGSDSLTILGYKGSYAETFSGENGIPFTVIDGQPVVGDITYAELRVDSSGQEVLDMKQRFYELGYYRTTEFNDRFTDNTADTVKLFEKNNGLPVDGVADAGMLGVLFSDVALPK